MQRIEQGMPITALATPAVLVDVDILENNIKETADAVKGHGKELWPMVKTHKSLEIAQMQHNAGASGFLCGPMEEAEMLVGRGGFKEIMLAYPVADEQNLQRCVKLCEKANLIFRVDSEETATLMSEAFGKAGKSADYVIKVDVGVHRFGVEPEKIGELVKALSKYKNLNFLGISTHPGHVYSSKSPEELKDKTLKSLEFLHTAYERLRSYGYELKMITIGSTPSFQYDIEDGLVTHVHPGNYVYYDAMQVALGTIPVERCALTVLVAVTSRPRDLNEAAINAGVKVFSRDVGGHEIKVVKGYGIVKGFPKAEVKLLSEEVGLIDIKEEPDMKVGEKVEIIPNHSCVVNNHTSYLIGHRAGIVERLIAVDARVGL